MTLLRTAVVALAMAGTVALSMPSPAKADWYYGYGRPYYPGWGPGYYAGYYYRPPPVYYAPPVVYAPPPPVYYSPGVTFGVTIR